MVPISFSLSTSTTSRMVSVLPTRVGISHRGLTPFTSGFSSAHFRRVPISSRGMGKELVFSDAYGTSAGADAGDYLSEKAFMMSSCWKLLWVT